MEKNMIELNKLYKLCTLCKELKLDKKLFGQLKKTLYEAEFILESKNEQLIIKILDKNIEPGVPVRELENHPNAESIVKAIISTMTSNEINMIEAQPQTNPIIVCIDILKSFLKYIVNNNNIIISRDANILK